MCLGTFFNGLAVESPWTQLLFPPCSYARRRNYPSDWWINTPWTHAGDEFSWNSRSLPSFWLKSVPNIFQIGGKNRFGSFNHSVVCLMTGPQAPLKRVLHTVQYSAAYFNFQYPLFTLTSVSSCLRLFPLPLVSYILLSNSSSIMCFRKTVPMQNVTNLVSLPSLYCV